MQLKFNPFHDAGITSYEQFKLYPYLVFGTAATLKNRIEQQINQIKQNHFFSDRLVIIGERGIGKTSNLYFLKDMLSEAGVNVVTMSRLIQDENHLMTKITQDYIQKYPQRKLISTPSLLQITEKPLYILVDFPDTIEGKKYKQFLDFLWELMTHKNYNKINLIFSMNTSHFEKSFDFSEIFGKFLTIRLERLTIEETKKLIDSRLKIVGEELNNIFSEEAQSLIFQYSKGIPRNIVSACSLLIDNANGSPKIDASHCDGILKEKYFDQVINDRVEDLELRRIYKSMIDILKNQFNSTTDSQEEYVKRVMNVTGVGRNSVISRIQDLVKFGIFNQYRGGYNRLNKILSLDEEKR